MPKARTYEEIEQERNLPPAQPVGFGDLSLLAIPTVTFKALVDEAARRNMTVAQLIQKAFEGVLGGKP